MKKILFFNFLTIIFIFLIIEFALRIFNIVELQGFNKKSFFKKDGITYHKPNISMVVMGKMIKTDPNGFRVPLTDYKLIDNQKSIIILGDSVSFGVSVEERNTFIGRLRSQSKKNLLNTSVAGHRLEDYTFLIKKYNNDFPQVKEILIFLCLNDIVLQEGVLQKENLETEIYDNKNFISKLINNKLFIKLNFFLRDKSATFNLIKAVSTNNVKRHYNYMSPYYLNKNYLEEYEKNLKKIIDYADKKQLEIKFILLPYKYQIKKDCQFDIMNPQYQISLLFRKLNQQLFDFSDDFCNKNNNKKLFLNFDPVHLSSAGHKFVSKLLIDKGVLN